MQNDLGICVLDSNGPGGAPGDTLCTYFQWPFGAYPQVVTFPVEIVPPHPDFYIVYVQTGWGGADANTYGLDTSSPWAGRSWSFVNHAWSPMGPAYGNVMIHALVQQATPTEAATWGRLKGTYR